MTRTRENWPAAPAPPVGILPIMAQPPEGREFREQNNRVLSAMREDLADLRSHVNNLSSRVDNGFAEMRGKLDAAAAGQEQIAMLLSTLIEQGNGPHDGQ